MLSAGSLRAIALLVLVSIGVAASTALGASHTGLSVGRRVDLSAHDLFPHGCGGSATFPGADFETHVAVNPRRPSNIVATWIEGTGVTAVVSATHDGGRTWHETRVPGLRCTGDSGTVLSGDPWLSFGPHRTLYLTAGTDTGGSDPLGTARHVKVVVSRSTNGGRTWTRAQVVESSADFNDKMTVTADPRRPGHAWIAFTKGRPPDYSSGDLYLSETRDGGHRWSAPHLTLSTLTDPVPMYPWGNTLRVLPGGELLDTLMLWQPAGVTTVPLPRRGDYQAVAIRSRDGGATWSSPTTIASVPVGRIRGDGAEVRANQGVAMDTSSGGTAYATWWQAGPLGAGEVVLSRSANGGVSWTAPKVVAHATRSAFLPAVAAGPGRAVAVSYYDLRHDRGGDGRLTADAWLAESRDGGAHWREVHIGGPFDLRTAASVDGEAFIGDYFGLARTPRGFGAVDVFARPISRNGPSDAYYIPVRLR